MASEDIYVELDKTTIKNTIHANKFFKSGDIELKSWEGDTDIDSLRYVGKIQNRNYYYFGILDENLKRDHLGVNKYSNGDLYYGKWHNDEKNKLGIYLYSPVHKDEMIFSELYHGQWNRNKKHDKGLYMWRCDDTNGKTIGYEAYIGELSNDNYKQSVYIYFNGKDDYSIYFGKFDSDGLKHDERGIFYSKKENRLVIGNIERNILLSGYFIYYDKDQVKSMKYVITDDEGKIIKLLYKDDIMGKEEILQTAENFVNYIFENNYVEELKEYFNMITQKIHSLKDYTIFDSDDYIKYMDLLSLHNKFIKLYNNLKELN